MTDDPLIERLSEQLRELPLLDAPAEISDRVAAEIRREPQTAEVSAGLAALETMQAPGRLDEALSTQRRPVGIRRRLRRLTHRGPSADSPSSWRPAVVIGGLAVGGLLIGLGAVEVVSRIGNSGAQDAYLVQAHHTFLPPQHDEPTGPARMTIHVKATPEGTVWHAEAVAVDGSAVTPTCAGPGATPVATPTTQGASPPPTTTLDGGASIQCSADVGTPAPITGAMAVVSAPGTNGSTVSVVTTAPTGGSTPSGSTSSTSTTQSSSSSTTNSSSAPATTAGP